MASKLGTKLVIEGATVTRTVGDTTQTADLSAFTKALGAHAPIETGLLPPGVRSFRQAGDHHQFLLEMPPGINHICWGDYEGGPAEWFVLAQPWVYGIAEFLNNNFLGARMFYSPTQISTINDQLYAVPLPNLNWRGYGSTGVGWCCLYHVQNTSKMTLAEQALYVIHRLSGMEAYNDANMSSTDGPRFYKAMNKPKYTWDPHAWEAKTKTEGVDWVFAPGLWIPVLVKGIDDQSRYADGGVALTLEMAMVGNAHGYYHDTYQPKPINALHRGQTPAELDGLVYDAAFVAAHTQTPTAKQRTA